MGVGHISKTDLSTFIIKQLLRCLNQTKTTKMAPLLLSFYVQLFLTVDPRNRPVASDTGGGDGQLEDKRSGIGVRIGIGGCDVDTVDVPVGPLADLRLPGYERRGVVINIYQVDLQRARATGCRGAWERGRGKTTIS